MPRAETSSHAAPGSGTTDAGTSPDLRTPAERHRALSWAQRLKRVFGIEIETCEQCGGRVKVIASMEDPVVIGRILGHRASRKQPAGSRPPSRGHPKASLSFRNGGGRSGPGRVHDAGVAGCTGDGLRRTNPAAFGRFAGSWSGAAARRQVPDDGGRDSGLANFSNAGVGKSYTLP